MKILVVFCLVFLTFGLQSNIAVNTWFKGYHFDARVRIHKHGNANEFLRGSKRYISVHEGDVYSILIKIKRDRLLIYCILEWGFAYQDKFSPNIF